MPLFVILAPPRDPDRPLAHRPPRRRPRRGRRPPQRGRATRIRQAHGTTSGQEDRGDQGAIGQGAKAIHLDSRQAWPWRTV